MTLEPPVLRSIKKYRRRVAVRQLAIVGFPVLLALVVALVMFAAGLDLGPPDRTHPLKSGPVAGVVVALLFLAMPVLIYFFVAAYQRRKFRNEVLAFVSPFADETMTPRFANGLSGACIATDLEEPNLVAARIGQLSTFSFAFSRGGLNVAVTREVLDAGLSSHEAESLMAREVATILLGDYVKTALWFSPERVAAMAPTFIVFLLFLLGLFLNSKELLLVGTGMMFVVFVVTYMSDLYEGLMKLLFRGLGRRDELLVDSIAVKITGNPMALSSALARLEGLGLLGHPQPTLKLFKTDIRNLFRLPGRGYGGLVYRVFNVSEPDRDQLLERLGNLERIQKGDWRCFGMVADGEAFVDPGAWE